MLSQDPYPTEGLRVKNSSTQKTPSQHLDLANAPVTNQPVLPDPSLGSPRHWEQNPLAPLMLACFLPSSLHIELRIGSGTWEGFRSRFMG